MCIENVKWFSGAREDFDLQIKKKKASFMQNLSWLIKRYNACSTTATNVINVFDESGDSL